MVIECTSVTHTEPTASQDAFVQSESPGKIIFGSRQIGKTTALALDVVETGTDSRTTGPIGVTAPTMRQGRHLLDRCREIAFEKVGRENIGTSHLAEFIIPDGTSVQYVPITDLYMSEKDMHPSRADEFEYLVVDEVDFVPERATNSILSDWQSGDVRGLSVAGTARTDSPAIKGLVQDDKWFSVYDTLANSDWVDNEDLEQAMKNVGPEQSVTEYRGLFVSDPAEDADIVNGE